MLSEKIANRICTLSPGQKRPLSTVVFLCPSEIINTGLVRILSIMVGCCRRSKGRPFLDGSANLIQPAPNDFALILGGLKFNPGETAMRTYAKNSTKTQTPNLGVRLKSVFTLKHNRKQTIAEDLSFKQAKNLANHIPKSKIQFDRMEAFA